MSGLLCPQAFHSWQEERRVGSVTRDWERAPGVRRPIFGLHAWRLMGLGNDLGAPLKGSLKGIQRVLSSCAVEIRQV